MYLTEASTAMTHTHTHSHAHAHARERAHTHTQSNSSVQPRLLLFMFYSRFIHLQNDGSKQTLEKVTADGSRRLVVGEARFLTTPGLYFMLGEASETHTETTFLQLRCNFFKNKKQVFSTHKISLRQGITYFITFLLLLTGPLPTGCCLYEYISRTFVQ